MLEVAERETLASLWTRALSGVVIRHPNPSARPSIAIGDELEPMLLFSIGNHRDTGDKNHGQWSTFVISNVRLTFFPGEALARMWVAAAWAGYVQHEALELVTVDGVSPLDPHRKPYATNPWNRGLRDGLPPVLTRETLVAALAVVMDREHAERLISEAA